MSEVSVRASACRAVGVLENMIAFVRSEAAARRYWLADDIGEGRTRVVVLTRISTADEMVLGEEPWGLARHRTDRALEVLSRVERPLHGTVMHEEHVRSTGRVDGMRRRVRAEGGSFTVSEIPSIDEPRMRVRTQGHNEK